MTINPIATGLLLAALATSPAAAQGIPQDVRCVILSGMFVNSAKDEKGKQIARLTGAFYLGRVDGRADAKAIIEALRSESKTIDDKTAGPLMDACVSKLAQAQTTMNALGKTLGTSK